MKNYLLIGFVLLVCVVAGFFWRVWGETYTIILTEEQLTEKLNQKFPFEKTYLFVLTLTFTDPKLVLEEGSNRIGLGCNVETALKIETDKESPGYLRGSAQLSGVLRYEAAEGAFFLDEPRVDQLSITGLPSKFSDKVNSAAGKAVKEFLSRAPLYRLKPTDVKKAAAKLVLRNVIVVDKKVVITLGVG